MVKAYKYVTPLILSAVNATCATCKFKDPEDFKGLNYPAWGCSGMFRLDTEFHVKNSLKSKKCCRKMSRR